MKRVACTVSLVLLVTGCDKIQEKLANKVAEKAVESAGGGPVKIDTSGGETTLTDPKTGTTVTSGAAVKLPPGWPASVPVYPGATIRNALSTPGAKTATLATKDAPAKVTEFYKTKSGLKLESDIDLGQQHVCVFKNGKGNVTVSVGQAGADTMITLAVVD